MKILKDEKAQTSLEYLLTITVSILLAAVIFSIAIQTTQILNWVDAKVTTYRKEAILMTAE